LHFQNDDVEVIFWLTSGTTNSTTIQIGRKNCDINLEDKSVSRFHAELILERPKAKLGFSELFLVDKSKLGTFVNATQVLKG
jgi:pSer/pThr/pTyr-binding forkhead associated (FHA) protein